MAVYDRDYLTTLPLLYEKADEYSLGDWNKYNDDVGDTLLKLIASSSHSVDYYFRKFLTSLILPNDDWDQKALIWELTGYKPNYIRADYMMVQLYWPDCGLDTYIPVYQYTPFKVTADGKEYTFLCAQDYIIPPLMTRYNIRLVNGTLHTIEQDYTQVLDNKIKLTDSDIDYDLVNVIISGVKWTQVRNVFYSPNTERIFSVHKEDDGTYMYLHSTWRDYVDAYDTSFLIYFVESYYDFELFTDDCMTVEFETELLTIDGDDVSEFYKITPLLNSDEAIDATNLLPSTTEGNRAITTLDFETNAALFPGIASCKAYDWNTPEVCKTKFEVALIACDSKGNLSDHMKQVLKSYLESICSPLINVNVLAPKLSKQDIMVVLDIGDYKGTLAEVELKRLVQRTLESFYEIGNLPPGRVVSTKELNSLLLHADSRIYFATTSFLNPQVNNPMLIPILGNVITITSAEAISRYDFGTGFDKGYIDPHPKDAGYAVEKADDIGITFKFMFIGNELAPIDKLPLQAFDFVHSEESRPLFNIGLGEFMEADFGYGNGFTHVLATGGDETGPLYRMIYETDGSSIFVKRTDEVTNRVRSELKFENSLGTFYVDPGIYDLDIVHDDIPEIKDQLAIRFNAIPQLKDEYGDPFDITGDDIYYPLDPVEDTLFDESDEPLGISHVTSKNVQDGHIDVLTDVPDKISKEQLNTEYGQNTEDDKPFIYVPMNNDNFKRLKASGILDDGFIKRTTTTYDHQSYIGFEYQDKGKYAPEPNAYGDMTFTANVYLDVTTTTDEFYTNVPNIHEEQDKYLTEFFVRETNGNPVMWYFINTSPVQSVAGCTEIGYGIMVGFHLLRDQALYVECDPATNRGFIYSSYMEPTDFYIVKPSEE